MSLKKVNLDFQILETKDPNIISIMDSSEWSNIENKPSIIEIFIPGKDTPIVHFFNKKQINLFNSINLKINCVDDCGEVDYIQLPDGIYTIVLKGSPDKYIKSRKYLRTVSTELKLDKIFIGLELTTKYFSSNKSTIDSIFDIELMLKAAKANLRYSNIKKTQSLLFKAQDLIEDLISCKT